jgi:hypothetical protein
VGRFLIIPHVITDARLDHVAHAIFVLDDEVAGYDVDDVTLVAPVIAKVASAILHQPKLKVSELTCTRCRCPRFAVNDGRRNC